MSITFETVAEHNRRVTILLVIAISLILAGLFSGLFFVLNPIGVQPNESLWYGAIFGVIVSTILAFFSINWGDSAIALIVNAKLIYKTEDPILFNVTEEMAIAAGLPTPKIYSIPDSSPNALAMGKDPQHASIAITTGLRSKLTRDELQAVVAHEIAHISNFDTRLMGVIATFAGTIVLLSDFIRRGTFDRVRVSGSRGENTLARNTSARAGFGLIYVFITLLVAWLAPLLAKILQLAISRKREYLADATAVQFCRNPLALASALKKIALDEEETSLTNRATEHLFIINPNLKITKINNDSIWSTHPPVIKRIELLEEMAK